jgi:hypothetical protein
VAAKKAISNAHFNVGKLVLTYNFALLYSKNFGPMHNTHNTYFVFSINVRRRDDLVYIKFNGRMIDKRMKYESSCDVLLAKDASMAQDWICEGAYVDDEVNPITELANGH